MIKGPSLQEDTAILKVHLPNNKATKYARDYGRDCIPGVIFSGTLELLEQELDHHPYISSVIK